MLLCFHQELGFSDGITMTNCRVFLYLCQDYSIDEEAALQAALALSLAENWHQSQHHQSSHKLHQHCTAAATPWIRGYHTVNRHLGPVRFTQVSLSLSMPRNFCALHSDFMIENKMSCWKRIKPVAVTREQRTHLMLNSAPTLFTLASLHTCHVDQCSTKGYLHGKMSLEFEIFSSLLTPTSTFGYFPWTSWMLWLTVSNLMGEQSEV